MLKQILKQKYYIIAITVLIFLEPSLNSVLNFWLQRMFNTAQPGVDRLIVLRLLTFGFLLWMVKRLISFTSSILSSRFICRMKYDLKHKMFYRIFGMDISNIHQIGSNGEYITAFTTDINLLETRFYTQVINLVSAIVSILIMGSSLIALEKRLATVILSFACVFTLIPFLFTKMLNEKSSSYSRAMSRFTTGVKEFITGYSTVKNNSAEQRILRKFDEYNADVESKKFDSDFALSLANNVGSMLAWFLQLCAVGLGLVLIVRGDIMIGTVMAAQGFASDLAEPFQRIVSSWNSISSIKSILNNLQNLSSADTPHLPETDESVINNDYEQGCSIEFKDVGLVINNKPIIQNFNFLFEKGKKYLIVGENGAGKSTLFKLSKRWFTGSTGKILLNDRDISTMSMKEINSVLSYIDPTPAIFSGSVRENLTLFSDVQPERLKQAMASAHVDLDLNRQIDDKTRTSTGQAAKLDLGRAFALSNAKIFVFDETMANLDIETAYQFESAVLSGNETVISIAHNLCGDLIRKYDEILVLKDGRLIAHGQYDALRNSCDYFDRICRIKFGT